MSSSPSRVHNAPCGIDLVLDFPPAQIALDRVSKLPALHPSSSPIDGHNDVLQGTRHIMVPIAIELRIDKLGTWPSVSIDAGQISLSVCDE